MVLNLFALLCFPPRQNLQTKISHYADHLLFVIGLLTLMVTKCTSYAMNHIQQGKSLVSGSEVAGCQWRFESGDPAFSNFYIFFIKVMHLF